MSHHKPGVGNLFNIMGQMNSEISPQKFINLILKFYLHLPMGSREKKLCQGADETSPNPLSTCLLAMEFHFDAMLCSNFSNQNSGAGHIECSHRPQVPHPCHKLFARNPISATWTWESILSIITQDP